MHIMILRHHLGPFRLSSLASSRSGGREILTLTSERGIARATVSLVGQKTVSGGLFLERPAKRQGNILHSLVSISLNAKSLDAKDFRPSRY